MGIRQPGMKRYYRELHNKRDKETKHQPPGGDRIKLRIQQRGIVESECASSPAVDEIKAKNCKQHQQTTRLREDEKLVGCVSLVLVSPNPYQEIHRNEHHFPEEIQEEQIQGEENTGDSCK